MLVGMGVRGSGKTCGHVRQELHWDTETWKATHSRKAPMLQGSFAVEVFYPPESPETDIIVGEHHQGPEPLAPAPVMPYGRALRNELVVRSTHAKNADCKCT